MSLSRMPRAAKSAASLKLSQSSTQSPTKKGASRKVVVSSMMTPPSSPNGTVQRRERKRYLYSPVALTNNIAPPADRVGGSNMYYSHAVGLRASLDMVGTCCDVLIRALQNQTVSAIVASRSMTLLTAFSNIDEYLSIITGDDIPVGLAYSVHPITVDNFFIGVNVADVKNDPALAKRIQDTYDMVNPVSAIKARSVQLMAEVRATRVKLDRILNLCLGSGANDAGAVDTDSAAIDINFINLVLHDIKHHMGSIRIEIIDSIVTDKEAIPEHSSYMCELSEMIQEVADAYYDEIFVDVANADEEKDEMNV